MNTQLYVNKLNKIFKKYGIGIEPKEDDFCFWEEVVVESTVGRRISRHLGNRISPPIHEAEVYHYTPDLAGKEIIKSKKLRLTSVKKRLKDDEIREFLDEFGFAYSLEIDPDTKQPRYKGHIADSVLYISMTDTSVTKEEEEIFWRRFAEGDGFRLKFSIKVQSGCFRRMVYGSQIEHWADFFKEIQSMSLNDFGKHFHWIDSVAFSALYLPGKYSDERETRLTIRKSWGLEVKEENGIRFIELDFGHNESTEIDFSLIEIQTNQVVSAPTGVVLTPRT